MHARLVSLRDSRTPSVVCIFSTCGGARNCLPPHPRLPVAARVGRCDRSPWCRTDLPLRACDCGSPHASFRELLSGAREGGFMPPSLQFVGFRSDVAMTSVNVDKLSLQEGPTRPAQSPIPGHSSAEVSIASQCDESQVRAPSHQEASCSSHDISIEWPDWSDDVLSMWKSLVEPSSSGLDPIVTTESPQSPTGVDCFQTETTWKAEDIGAVLGSTGSTEGTKDPFEDAGKLRALLDLWLQEDSPLDDSGSDDSMVEDVVSDRSLREDFEFKEAHRVRQRGYEKRSKTKKRESLKSLRKRWLNLEMDFYSTYLQKKAKALVTNPRTTRQEQYEEQLLEEQALQCDAMLFHSAWTWRIMFALRNYTITEEELANCCIPEDEKPPEANGCTPEDEEPPKDTDTEEGVVDPKPETNYKEVFDKKKEKMKIPEEILCSRRRWAAIDRTIFEDSKVKPFVPLHFEFSW